MEKSFTFSKKSIAYLLLFLATFGAAFSWMYYAQAQEVKSSGPYLLTANERALYFNVNDTLYESDVDGNIVAHASLQSLNLQRPIADIQVFNDVLYILEGKTKRLKKCSLETKRCENILRVQAKKNQGALKMAFDANSSELYIANSGAHRIDVYDLSTKQSHRFITTEKLKFPNAILIENDKVIVSDSNHNRIVTLSRQGDTLSTFKVSSEIGTRGLKRALKVAHAEDGSWWSLNSDVYYEEREVIHYDKDGVALERFGVEGVSKLSQLERFNNKIILSDYLGFKLYVLQSNSEMLEFSSSAINVQLDKYREKRYFWMNQKYVSYFLFFLSAIFALIAMFSDTAQKKEEGFFESDKTEKLAGKESIDLRQHTLLDIDKYGYVWLKPNKSYVRLMKYVAPLFSIIILLSIFFVRASFLESNIQMQIVFVLTILILIGMILISKRASEILIGTNGRDIIIRDVFGRIADMPASEIQFTGRHLIAGEVTMSLNTKEGSLFDEHELKTYILPLLHEDKKINELEIMMKNLKSFDLKTYAGIVLSVIVLIILAGAK